MYLILNESLSRDVSVLKLTDFDVFSLSYQRNYVFVLSTN
ncbi:hypothetical protein ABID46_000215 [Moheibacter stercoris]|uniref:Uncharacterized protein n=1 Tax=Moheibacter stercoris TaxID=1628251 RepID=A0ABV2LQ10_9FLAO